MKPGGMSRPTRRTGRTTAQGSEIGSPRARRAMTRGISSTARAAMPGFLEPLQEALAIYREILGDGHLETAIGYNNLAVTLAAQGKPAEAEAMHRRALAIYLKALPEGHPDIARSYNNLAETLQDQRMYAEAEAMHRRALAFRIGCPVRGAPRHRRKLQQPGHDPPGPEEVRRGRGDVPPRTGHPHQGPTRGTSRHRPDRQQPGRGPSGPEEARRGRGAMHRQALARSA